MPTFLFTNTLMLAGMAALAIPVLIHLLLKRRKKRIQFSTVRFFQQQDEQSSRRRKLRNFFLLALRLLIVALLVLAFSRPYSRQNEAVAAARKQRRVVFVLDRSASMLATGTDGQRWALAKQAILKALGELGSDDAAALVDCETHALVLSGLAPAARISQLVRDLPPAYGVSSIGDGLREAVRLLSDKASGAASTI
ncbi:MAG TPA: BatA and WFA domain-containing protein, partial [Verrucomicrobiae bacterium]|nr:BatA and WFA domain-containing protein [Verrucomicrobiae bacterium]